MPQAYLREALGPVGRKPMGAWGGPLRGIIGTLSRHTICRERGLTLVPLTIARLPLFHRRLDGDMVACREHVAVKIRWASEQTLSVQRYMRAGSIVNAIA